MPENIVDADQNQSVLHYGGGGEDSATLLIINLHTASGKEGKERCT